METTSFLSQTARSAVKAMQYAMYFFISPSSFLLYPSVGNVFVKGVSGGQKRRASLGKFRQIARACLILDPVYLPATPRALPSTLSTYRL
jgi:hypothetical protein